VQPLRSAQNYDTWADHHHHNSDEPNAANAFAFSSGDGVGVMPLLPADDDEAGGEPTDP